MTIAVLGSINVDVTAYSDRLPRPGETIHGQSYLLGLGGKGANQAAAVAKLGAGLTFFGRTGRDAFGALARQELQKLAYRWPMSPRTSKRARASPSSRSMRPRRTASR